MSRIIIKNLPKKITEEKLHEIFSEKGTITDVQLKYTAEGVFRQFGFIGFQNENEAEEAVKFYNNSRLSTAKIIVERCALLGDSLKPKSWSKYAKDSSAYKNAHPEVVSQDKVGKPDKKKYNSKTEELLKKYKDDPQFEEFLQLHASKETQEVFNKQQEHKSESESDAESKQEAEQDEDNTSDSEVQKPALQHISDLEYMKALVKTGGEHVSVGKKEKQPKAKIKLNTVKLRGLPYSCKKKDIKQFFRPLVPYTIRIPPKIKGIAYIGFKTEKQLNQALLKDRSFINGKQISVANYKDIENSEQQVIDPKRNKWKTQEEALQNEENIAESGRIFIRNLSYTTTENDIQELFSKYGPLTEINLPVDKFTHKLKGFGIITFLIPEHAVKAYTELDGSILHGRMVHLLPGKAKDSDDHQENTTNYKQKKTLKAKAEAGSSHNWNALFLGHDAVADVIAQTYGTSKETVLQGDGSAAVRLALGETQIVTATRKFLEQEGVQLDAFNKSNVARSKTTILVKNLPAQTLLTEIKELFEKFGVLNRVIFPPSGITAMVEFIEPSEARKAFTKLAYSKFKHLPLYLEWAPENSLLPKKSVVIKDTETIKDSVTPAKEEEQNIETEELQSEETEEPEPDTTLFVKNLNFRTTDDVLYEHFKSCGKVHYATVATKKDKSNPTNILSMGYGFVRFMYKEGAEKALKNLQQTTLDGKSLELKRSERTLQNDVKTSRKTTKAVKQTGTKILVRNVPFQANRNELYELFKTFGEIKALRLPTKMATVGSSHRGFAFVDYFSSGDAKKAFEALSQSTHLYGRRLVLEWASTDDGVEEIRKRTAEHFHPNQETQSKKSVLNIE